MRFKLKHMSSSLIILLVLTAAGLWLVGVFNSLVRSRNRVKESWSDIDVQLKRRYDLIPNLVETVKGYAAHESGTLDKVIQARAKAMGAQSVAEHAQAENMLTGALKSLFALSEAYPQLRAVESFTKLQDELADTENKIQAARRFYNTNVLSLNTRVEQFPSNIVASMLGFKKEVFFEIVNAAEKEPVKVGF
ncbi:MAG: LemA family protein [Candidatus Yanofskybacteria bacterium GW2011_GWC2_41_9]|uniref:LemA family protein n=3 Tax=Parcubacteria group TaxID=1794811 RepID=A0A0G0XL74_9BACT|nr:MAG: LemA family protein [Candidatus Jorgensenbacteria bacterium GW2011_GWF2_41_8]KKS27783.1 MAG: LemA family protein [Candidatus Yanofskybacteria bacterium GW2011_GWC2_41_9]